MKTQKVFSLKCWCHQLVAAFTCVGKCIDTLSSYLYKYRADSTSDWFTCMCQHYILTEKGKRKKVKTIEIEATA
ncbi:Uncharacterized protein APZ42_019676 [Daphnia magna]|uniref:Uncharacterized protein n=1 Tax=Daphnia magna TaxID=35525 RepID=A0A164YBF9_9CRUS|nr:Uncharacterized protein APZ42_019676 [Daphnia magna]